MPKLPVVSGEQCRKALERWGYIKHHQTGSHMIMVKPSCRPITVPRHDTIDRGLLRGIIRSAELSVEQFIWLTRK
jgi:predicted RNA binding protein YcfA (HicA-like mRNA interferase family)